MHDDAIIYYNLTSKQFYDMCIAEFNLHTKRFKYQQQQQKLLPLDTAMYAASLIMNPKAKEVYNDFYEGIMGKQEHVKEENSDFGFMDYIAKTIECGFLPPEF